MINKGVAEDDVAEEDVAEETAISDVAGVGVTEEVGVVEAVSG